MLVHQSTWKRSERKLECLLKSCLFVKDEMPQNTPQGPLRKEGLLWDKTKGEAAVKTSDKAIKASTISK